MKGKTIFASIGILFALLLGLSLVSASQSFTITPGSDSRTLTVGGTASGSFLITNTGSDPINLTITANNLASGSNTITLNKNTTSITDLGIGATANVTFNYDTSSKVAGAYTGSIVVSNLSSGTPTQTFSVSLTLNAVSGGAISLTNGNSNNTFEMDGDVDEKVNDNAKFKNTGNVSYTSVTATISDLEGDEDTIDSSDIDLNDNSFSLNVGETETVEVEIDIPDDIVEDVYEGSITLTGNNGDSFSIPIKVRVTADDVEVLFLYNKGDVDDGVLKVTGEAGELVDNFDVYVENNANIDIENLEFEIDGPFDEEFSSNTMPASAVSFVPSSLDIQEGEEDNVEFKIQIPDNQAAGTYFADLRLLSSTGTEYDKITVEVKVVGDVFVENVEIPESVAPDSSLEVKVTLKNQESKLLRNVKITGTIFDVDTANSDVTDTTSSFILDVKESKEETLRFKIPDDARDGSKTLEIRVSYEGGEITEVEEISIERPDERLVIDSFVINPQIVICESRVNTLMKIENLGRYDEDVTLTAEVKGTTVRASSNKVTIDQDQSVQRNLVLDVSSLSPGTYTVEQKVIYSGSKFVKAESTFRIDDCDGTSTGGVDIKPIGNVTEETNTTSEDKVEVLGLEMEKTTAYLGGGVGVLGVLIIFALFFL